MTQLSFDVAMLATPHIDHYAAATRANWQAYCDRDDYRFTCWREAVLDDMHMIWSKIELMRRHMRDMTANWLVVVDADTVVNKPERTPLLERFTDSSDAFVLHDKRLPACKSLSVEDLPLKP